MKFLSDFLQESFNNPYPWDWALQTPNKYTAKFYTDKATIGVKIEKNSDGVGGFWTFRFITLKGANGKSNIDNLGNFDAFRTLATVMEIFKEFLQQIEPDHVVFSGDKSDGKSKLYEMMLIKFKPQLEKLGYSVDNLRKTTSQFQRFSITKIHNK